ncbi:hypothetical protein [Corallococcus sp. M7]
MRKQLVACVLAVSVFLAGGTAEAFPPGWEMNDLGDKVLIYNHKHELVWSAEVDEKGDWHETIYKPTGGSGREQGETLGGIKSASGYVLVEIPKSVGGLVVMDASKREVVFEVKGGLEAGSIVKIPASKLGGNVQMLATVDDAGVTLDVAFFGWGGTCDSRSFWVSR